LSVEFKGQNIQLEEVEPIVADNLINYLKSVRGNQQDHAVRHAKTLKSVFAFAQDNGWIPYSKFANKSYKRGVKKEIYFLNEKEIRQIVALQSKSTTGKIPLYILMLYRIELCRCNEPKGFRYSEIRRRLDYISKARQKGAENSNLKKKIFFAPILPEAENILKNTKKLLN
jgi:site-specific recombinase XerD